MRRAILLLLAGCASATRVTSVATTHVPLEQDAAILGEVESALYAVVAAGGAARRYHGSGFVWNDSLKCYVATGWPERAQAATSDDQLRVELCPDATGRFAVAIAVAAGGTFFAIDRGRARVSVAVDDDRGVVDVVFDGIDTREHDVVMGAGGGGGYFMVGTIDPLRFQGRIIGSIKLVKA